MKLIRLSITLLGLIFTTLAFSQISHGGSPYFLQNSFLRASSKPFFIEMPSFDLDSLLRGEGDKGENMRGGYKFAHKFLTDISINDAVKTVLEDGTVVKQIGIRSAGAYSINLLLRDFDIPKGGKLFIFSYDRSHVLGSFDHRNNNPEKVLPIQPVTGDAVIIEYSEPSNTSFSGQFTVSEVNHDYRDIFRVEPKPDHNTYYNCMPDVFCENVIKETIRSTVLLIFNGNVFCSGSIITDASAGGEPYLLTAAHCFGTNSLEYPKDKDFWVDRSGTIIAFFNYDRPVCDAINKMKASEEMSLSGSFPCVILKEKDVALLKFFDFIPEYFNAYYAGWNRDLTEGNKKLTNLHHPLGAVKKFGMTDNNIKLYHDPKISGLTGIDATNLWVIPYWITGSTHEGSSGSPLFDENNLVIGGLTGGSSACRGTSPNNSTDYFFAFGKGWETGDKINQLKTWLDPDDKGLIRNEGKDPNLLNPVIRLSNADYRGSDLLITSELNSPNKGYVFGNSNLKTLEFAEEFNVENPVDVFGTYLMIPAMPYDYTSGVTISIYTGESFPEKKIFTTAFFPRYNNYSSYEGFDSIPKSINVVPTETFVVFKDINSNPVSINSKKFFISYSINFSATNKFCVYNTKRSDISFPNTAWLKDEIKGWTPADIYEYYSTKTSLAIQPVIRKSINNKIENVKFDENKNFYFERSSRELFIKLPVNARGQISIYSVSGQLLEKVQIQPNQASYSLRERQKGTVCIVKIMCDDFTFTGKIMY